MKSVFICGSGRSGTSMLAGLFSECSYYQGDNLYQSRKANPKGFFENWQINSLNERIILSSIEAGYGQEASGLLQLLYRPGQYWLANLPASLRYVAADEEKKEISSLVAREPFCYKDPRFCYTLEPWLDAAPDALALCVLRHPGVVVASILKELQSADYLVDLRISVANLYEVWRHMYLRALSLRACGRNVYFINYNDLLGNDKQTELEEFVDAKLNRSFPDKQLDRSDYVGELDETTQAFFSALSGLASERFAGQSQEACAAMAKQFSSSITPQHLLDDIQGSQPHYLSIEVTTAENTLQPLLPEGTLQELLYRFHEQEKDIKKRIAHLESDLAERDRNIGILIQEIDRYKQDMEAIKRSMSWRLTAPFRAIRRW